MLFTQFRLKLRLGAALLAGAVVTGAAGAQTVSSPGVYREDPSVALNRHLKDLADNPRGLSSLTGAAKAALELGDAQAAVTFYARAEEIAPRDGRIKAGIGAAFLAMEQPESALKFLEEARTLGVPDGELASDRGLANDLLGNSAQAQRDYAVAMRSNDGDELRRRLALSRAITGDRAGALAALQEQLQRKDRAGWRVRAFVLALTGDANGATEAARAVMPQQAAALAPFFARLPSLRPADRAMAVHFGHFPGDGAPGQTIQSPPTYAGVSPNILNAGRPGTTGSSLGTRLPTQAPITTPTLRPKPNQYAARPTLPQSQPVQQQRTQPAPTAQPAPSRPVGTTATQPSRAQPSQPAQRPVQTAIAEPARSQPVQPSRTEPSRPAPRRSTRPGMIEDYEPIGTGARRSSAQPSRTPRTTGSLNSSALAQSRPAAETGVAARPNTSAPVTPPAARPVEFAANSVSRPASPAPATTVPNAPTVQSPSAAPTGPVQGPPNGAAPASAVAIGTSAGAAASAPVQGPPSPGISVIDLPQSAAAGPSQPLGTAAGSLSAAASAGAATPPPTAPTSSTSQTVPPPSTIASPPLAQPVQPAAPAPAEAPLSAATPPSSGAAAGLAGLAAAIRALPDSEPVKPAPVQTRKAETPPKTTAKAEAPKPSLPSRHWVQVAGTADEAGLNREFARIKAKAPKLFAGKSAWTTPLRFTNRLLVGPFASDAEAQAFVNELAKADLSAFTWTSPSGQEIVKLAAR